MPVVGRADDDGVDVFAIEELAIVLADIGLPLADATVVLGLPGVSPVNIADGQEITEMGRTPGVAGALTAGPDQAEARAIVLGLHLVGHGPAEGREKREQRGACQRDAEELPTVLRADEHRREPSNEETGPTRPGGTPSRDSASRIPLAEFTRWKG